MLTREQKKENINNFCSFKDSSIFNSRIKNPFKKHWLQDDTTKSAKMLISWF